MSAYYDRLYPWRLPMNQVVVRDAAFVFYPYGQDAVVYSYNP